jgi:hypothetical protein
MKWVWTIGAFAATNLITTAAPTPLKYEAGEGFVSAKHGVRLAIGLGVAYFVYQKVK